MATNEILSEAEQLRRKVKLLSSVVSDVRNEHGNLLSDHAHLVATLQRVHARCRALVKENLPAGDGPVEESFRDGNRHAALDIEKLLVRHLGKELLPNEL